MGDRSNMSSFRLEGEVRVIVECEFAVISYTCNVSPKDDTEAESNGGSGNVGAIIGGVIVAIVAVLIVVGIVVVVMVWLM